MNGWVKQAGFTMVETIVAVAVTSVVLAGAAVATMALQRSSLSAQHYAKGMNDGNRLVDYVTRDLRCATKVSRRISGTATPFLKGQTLDVTENDQLAIFVPDYYLANVPDNSSGSNYKKARYSRSEIPGPKTHYEYHVVVEIFGVTRTAKYPGSIEVRYLRKARSASDPTICFFRQEYEGATLRLEQEIAEKTESAKLNIVAVEKQAFQIRSDFASKWSGEAGRTGARQYVTVKLFNKRRD